MTDYSNLRPELIEKLKEFEKNKPEYKQLEALNDLADIMQVNYEKASKENKGLKKQLEALGALFTDVREQLVKLNAKEAPEAPDTATPVIKAIDKMSKEMKKELGKIEVKPEVKVEAAQLPEIKMPEIDVPQPVVNIAEQDLSPLTNKLKMIPAQLTKAVKSIEIPAQDNSGLEEKMDMMVDWLKSIDTATRMKPQPGVMPVKNAPGTTLDTGSSLVSEEYDYVAVASPTSTTETYTYKDGGSGGTTVATVTITYTDDTKNTVLSMERT